MTADEKDTPKIQIDSDWKQEAQEEKDRLAEEESVDRDGKERQALGTPTILNIVNALAMQAAMAFGGMRGPQGEAIPPDPEVARFHIDMLAVLEEKTAGNLTDEETKALSGVLHELRTMYVSAASSAGPPPQS